MCARGISYLLILIATTCINLQIFIRTSPCTRHKLFIGYSLKIKTSILRTDLQISVYLNSKLKIKFFYMYTQMLLLICKSSIIIPNNLSTLYHLPCLFCNIPTNMHTRKDIYVYTYIQFSFSNSIFTIFSVVTGVKLITA